MTTFVAVIFIEITSDRFSCPQDWEGFQRKKKYAREVVKRPLFCCRRNRAQPTSPPSAYTAGLASFLSCLSAVPLCVYCRALPLLADGGVGGKP